MAPKQRHRKKESRSSMTLTGHLRELRNRIVVCVVVFFVCCLIFLTFSDRIVAMLTDMGTAYGYVYVYLAPQELLMQYLRVTVVASLCVCAPLILYEIWAFARPGLTRKENLTVAFGLLFGLVCFAGGVVFAYRIILPFMLYFLISISSNSVVTASISVESYISFLLMVFVIFGCVFEMPVISLVLTRFGILKPQTMIRGRKVVIVLTFILAALITPPDIFSQVMVAVPMLLLYEISILICRILYHFTGKKKKAVLTENEGGDEEQS